MYDSFRMTRLLMKTMKRWLNTSSAKRRIRDRRIKKLQENLRMKIRAGNSTILTEDETIVEENPMEIQDEIQEELESTIENVSEVRRSLRNNKGVPPPRYHDVALAAQLRDPRTVAEAKSIESRYARTTEKFKQTRNIRVTMSVSNPNLNMHEGTNSCKGCNRPDTEEDMVACDKCNAWWHFSCAGVQASICDRSWRCPNCSTFCGTIGSEHSNASSARLRLKQLEEAKALEDKIRKEQADKEREFLAAKHQLESEIEARQSVSGSLRSHGSHRSRRSRVGTWVAEQDFTIGNRAIENPPETGKTSTPILTGQVGTGATAKILPPPQLNTQEQQQKYPTEQQQSYATLANERKKGLPPNTPLGLPKQLLPPAKPPGIPEPSFFPVNSSRTLEQKIPVAETTTTTKSVLASLNPMATTKPSHFSITLGAMQSQRLPAGPMNTAVSSYPALPAPPPMFSLGTLARQLPSTELPPKTVPTMQQMSTAGIMKPSLPTLPQNYSSDRMQPAPPLAIPLDPSSSSLSAPKPGMRQPAREDQPCCVQNSPEPFYREPSGPHLSSHRPTLGPIRGINNQWYLTGSNHTGSRSIQYKIHSPE
nr:uncharacterized protein LOC115264082 [Aedes albopictus]